jgi:DNA polymerase-1
MNLGPIKYAALIPEPNAPERHWLLDLDRHQKGEQSLASLSQVEMLVCLDAKEFLSQSLHELKPNLKLLCLSTLKKLLAKDHNSQLEIPELANPEEALEWVDKVLKKAFDEIERRGIGPLVQLECQLISVLVAMERAGLPFQKEKWLTQLGAIEEELEQVKRALEPYFVKDDGFLLFGPEAIDLNQVSIVKERLEKIVGHKLSGTSSSVLKNIDHEAARLLIRYRELGRMLNTYGENFLPKIVNNRLHGTFVAIASASGRSTCLNPNLQALPGDEAFQACIEPDAPNHLLYFDYGGFELRILAALSQDQELCQIFNDDRDIHSVVAEAIFNTEVSSEKNAHLRAQAKILNFGIIYGMGEKALAQQLATSQAKAQVLMNNYFKRFARVKEFLDGLEGQVKSRGYVETALGRRAYLNGQDQENLSHLLRVARNIPVQGTGAEVAKLAMCRVFKSFRELNLDARLVNMVHDEIVVECHQSQVGVVKDLVLKQMSEAFNAILPGIKAAVSVSAAF